MRDLGVQPNFKEKRSSQRIDARIHIQFQTNQEFADCYSKNISKGGIFLETEVLPDPNATIELVLDLTEATSALEPLQVTVMGRVVRLMSFQHSGKRYHQVALQFVDLPAQTQLLLDQVYSRLKA